MIGLNTTIFFLLNNLAGQSAWVDRGVVFLADYLAYILVAVSLIGLVMWQKTAEEKIRAFVGAVVALIVSRGVIVELVRLIYPHPRPLVALSGVHQLLTETSSSFPSGHATFFFALSAFIYCHNKTWGTIFFILSGLMGLARVVAGVHYPLDILGGTVLGILVGFVSFKLSIIKFRKTE